jgi:hypothetical protein
MHHIDKILIILNIKKQKEKMKEKEKLNQKSIYNPFYFWIKCLYKNKYNK